MVSIDISSQALILKMTPNKVKTLFEVGKIISEVELKILCAFTMSKKSN